MRIKKQYKLLIEIVVVLILLYIDQFTKHLAVLNLKSREAIVLIKDVLEFRYLQNSGAAFGILQNKIMFFASITVIIVAIIVYLKWKINNTLYVNNINEKMKKKFLFLDFILLFLIAGAVGNLIDRLRFDYVIDFIYFKLIDFPVFNVADCYVSVSAVILIFLFLFVFKDNEYGLLFPVKKQKG